MGWKLHGLFPKDLKKYVTIAVPHTSWHDFYIGILIRSIQQVKINFIAKKELFKFPFGYYFRWMGGEPIDRTPEQNNVETIAAIFNSKDEFRLNVAPEGTRKKVYKLKTGFYYIAKMANVPIVMVAFDYGNKEVRIAAPFYPTDDAKKDLEYIENHFLGVVGKVPEYSFGIKN